MERKKLLFAFDLRIEKRILKLHVFDDDSFEDLIQRFSKAANLSQRFYQKIKEKLEKQLRRLLTKQNCSAKIANKIQQFLEESKIVIIAITETEVCNPPFDQTPLRMLEENTFQANRHSAEEDKILVKKGSAILSKYASKQIYVQQEEDEIKKKIIKRQVAVSPYQGELQRIQTNSIELLNKTIQQKQLSSITQKNQHKIYQKVQSYNNSHEKQKTHSYYETYKLEKNQIVSLEKKRESNESLKKKISSIQENLIPARSSKELKNNYANSLQTKLQYNNCIEEGRGVAWGLKQNKKFSYLEDIE